MKQLFRFWTQQVLFSISKEFTEVGKLEDTRKRYRYRNRPPPTPYNIPSVKPFIDTHTQIYRRSPPPSSPEREYYLLTPLPPQSTPMSVVKVYQ